MSDWVYFIKQIRLHHYDMSACQADTRHPTIADDKISRHGNSNDTRIDEYLALEAAKGCGCTSVRSRVSVGVGRVVRR